MKNKKPTLFKITFLTLTMVILFANSAEIMIQKASFSGTWKINLKKSEFGTLPAYAAYKQIKVIQDEMTVTLEFITTDQNGIDSPPSATTYSLDGKSTEKVLADQSKMFATIQWSANRNTFTKINTYTLPGNQAMDHKITDVWGLSADGKTLTIDRSVESAKSSYVLKAVYDKQ